MTVSPGSYGYGDGESVAMGRLYTGREVASALVRTARVLHGQMPGGASFKKRMVGSPGELRWLDGSRAGKESYVLLVYRDLEPYLMVRTGERPEDGEIVFSRHYGRLMLGCVSPDMTRDGEPVEYDKNYVGALTRALEAELGKIPEPETAPVSQ